MDCVYVVGVKVYCVEALFCKESLVAKADATDSAYAVAVPKAAYYCADYVVQT